ncbi:carbohydrate kinase [Bifidobacterium dolichotidis]|uniref:Carbohydrate kinase n=1 Tax=Bifidobacterium dolichotidis TaxID=2306976 RepID=A0A430FRX0_9BIFI|nr:PfkB family carbohydrate kinase [Bifidobacterium dolichotidis]RSX55609.1 carbohydrate kinase [Bifidobacterium dolichotidis]
MVERNISQKWLNEPPIHAVHPYADPVSDWEQQDNYDITQDRYVVVIGGMNMDICGRPGLKIVSRDSNPGMVTLSPGGVGQNIAQNLAHLGVPVSLVTVYGGDENGAALAAACAVNHIDLSHAECINDRRTSTYLFITDETGDMQIAVNDMGICEEMTPEFLQRRIDFINNAALCVVEANLSEDTLTWLGDHVTVPLLGDTVSTFKAHHFDHVLAHMGVLKPNHLEAQELTGIAVQDEESAQAAATALLDRGVATVCISMGIRGMLCARRVQNESSVTDEFVIVPPFPTKIATANGAGDAGMAAIAWSYFDNPARDLEELGRISQAASSVALECTKAVPDLTVDRLRMKLALLA